MKDESTSHDAKDLVTDMTRIVSDLGELESPPSGARASLIVLSGWEIGREIDVSDCPVVLGRSLSAGAFVNATSVSRRHARIDRVLEGEDEHFTVTDLNSSNGTLVNNLPATCVQLHDGDKIRMGDVLFKFVLQDTIDAQFHQEVHRLIHYDQLTGLLTMDTFRWRLDSVIQRSGQRRPFALAMTDLDGLKRVNDTYGHLAGRMVVQEMGAMMRQTLRGDDLAALYGGDEAIILYPDTSLGEAQAVAETLRKMIEARVFEHQGHTFGVTISQGLAEWPRHADSAEKLIAAADRALYAAKSAGRNCVRTADVIEG